MARAECSAGILRRLTGYLLSGGAGNMIEVHQVSFGSAAPDRALPRTAPMPEHGIYLPDLERRSGRLAQAGGPAKPVTAVLFYRAHLLSGNTGFLDALSDALETRGPTAVRFSPASRPRRTVSPAFNLVKDHAQILISTLSFCVNPGEVTARRRDRAASAGACASSNVAAGMSRGAWELSPRG
jgi:cobaltochelatase CobN